jgi:hypothetical protein
VSLGKAHLEVPPGVWGYVLWVPSWAQRGPGCLINGSARCQAAGDSGQWPNRPRHMLSGPRQKRHSSRAVHSYHSLQAGPLGRGTGLMGSRELPSP